MFPACNSFEWFIGSMFYYKYKYSSLCRASFIISLINFQLPLPYAECSSFSSYIGIDFPLYYIERCLVADKSIVV